MLDSLRPVFIVFYTALGADGANTNPIWLARIKGPKERKAIAREDPPPTDRRQTLGLAL